MTIPEQAVQNALNIANDDSHGYDQNSRWGPDYDCSSLVITAYIDAGIPLQCTYTGNMRSDMFKHGFAVASGINLTTGEGLRPGDVLLNEQHHTALYIGDGRIVHARGNERDGITGGKTGDQTGKEICTQAYYNYPWDYVLRYVAREEEKPSGMTLYTIRKGDTLWGIAEKFLGHGWDYPRLISENPGLTADIYPGQVIAIPGEAVDENTVTFSVTVRKSTYASLFAMAKTKGCTIGELLDKENF